MNTFDDLKNIWLAEDAQILPEPDEVKTVITKYQQSKKRNVWLLFIAAILLLACLFFIMILHPATSLTTIAGEVLMVAGFTLTIILKLKTLQKTRDLEALSNDRFLQALQYSVAFRPKANLLQIVGIVTLSAGYGFFIYDSVKDDLVLSAVAYAGIIAFALGMYFIFRPFAQRKARAKSRRLMENIAKIENQF